ncbi:MAG TPA: glycosyltransferase family 1 protein [Chloroflexi bacterium]|nr:glycosyltransferase family 1 protein [Chloroflexota bacterium]
MRILYFTKDYTPHDHRFLSALAETEHEVFSLRLEKRGVERESRPLPAGVNPVRWAGGCRPVDREEYPALVRDLATVLEAVRPDVVHAGSVQTAALLTAMAGFHPLVTMSWGYDLLMDADSSSRMLADTRFTLETSDAFVCDCQAVAEKAKEFGFPSERITILPWGVDLGHFSPEQKDQFIRQQLGWDNDEIVVLSTRAWEPVYDVGTVVQGFIEAAAQNSRLRLILLGGGSQAQALQEMITEAGVADKVWLGGRTQYADLPGYYQAADVYVSASLTDGSSLSLMESLACATPAIVSDIPGNREWVVEGENGWFFPVGDWQALSAKLQEIAAVDPLRWKQMGRNARDAAEKRANWPENFKKLVTAYNIAMEGSKDA